MNFIIALATEAMAISQDVMRVVEEIHRQDQEALDAERIRQRKEREAFLATNNSFAGHEALIRDLLDQNQALKNEIERTRIQAYKEGFANGQADARAQVREEFDKVIAHSYKDGHYQGVQDGRAEAFAEIFNDRLNGNPDYVQRMNPGVFQ